MFFRTKFPTKIFQYITIMRTFRKLTFSFKQGVKYYSIRQLKAQSYYFINDLEHFPDKPELLLEYNALMRQVNSFKTYLTNELLLEAGIELSTWYNFSIKRYILLNHFKVLEVLGLKLNKESVFDSLVSVLEPFPVDKRILYSSKKWLNSVASIRDEIEMQYLSWKLKMNYLDVVSTMKSLKPSLFFGRSLNSIQRHYTFLPVSYKDSKIPLQDKVYILTTIPFKINNLPTLPPKIGGLRVLEAVYSCPSFLLKPSPIRELYIKILLSKGFSSKQIDQGLPFLNLHLKNLLQFVDYLLSSPLARSRHEIDFLKLLFFSLPKLKSLVDGSGKTFSDLMVIFKMKCKTNSRHANISQINFSINKYIEVDFEKVSKLRYHPQYLKCTVFSIEETMEYLLFRKFTEMEIIESLAIVLYPRTVIKAALTRIVREKENLKGYGFCDGEVATKTDLFRSGTTTKRKTLQICLFYLMKEIESTSRIR